MSRKVIDQEFFILLFNLLISILKLRLESSFGVFMIAQYIACIHTVNNAPIHNVLREFCQSEVVASDLKSQVGFPVGAWTCMMEWGSL